MLIEIIRIPDPDNNIVFDVAIRRVQGDIRLTEQWFGGALPILHSRHWDYVVLQEQSEWAMIPDEVNTTYIAGNRFALAIRKDGAIPCSFHMDAPNPEARGIPILTAFFTKPTNHAITVRSLHL